MSAPGRSSTYMGRDVYIHVKPFGERSKTRCEKEVGREGPTKWVADGMESGIVSEVDGVGDCEFVNPVGYVRGWGNISA